VDAARSLIDSHAGANFEADICVSSHAPRTLLPLLLLAVAAPHLFFRARCLFRPPRADYSTVQFRAPSSRVICNATFARRASRLIRNHPRLSDQRPLDQPACALWRLFGFEGTWRVHRSITNGGHHVILCLSLSLSLFHLSLLLSSSPYLFAVHGRRQDFLCNCVSIFFAHVQDAGDFTEGTSEGD